MSAEARESALYIETPRLFTPPPYIHSSLFSSCQGNILTAHLLKMVWDYALFNTPVQFISDLSEFLLALSFERRDKNVLVSQKIFQDYTSVFHNSHIWRPCCQGYCYNVPL